jgi:hypothetical protein
MTALVLFLLSILAANSRTGWQMHKVALYAYEGTTLKHPD